MELNQFRDVDVVLDKANDNIIQKQFVSAGDKDGRSLTAQLTDNGVIGEIIGASMNLYWHNLASGLTDLSAFYVVDRATSIFKIDYPQNMLTPGKVIAYIQILHGGKVTHTKPFEITVQNLAGTTRGVLATAEYSALVTTLAKANEFETEIAKKANESDVRKNNVPIGLNDASPEMLAAIQGGEGTTFNLKSEPRRKSVTPFSTTFIKTGKNIINPTKFIDGIVLQYDTGNLLDVSGFKTLDYTEILPGTEYTQMLSELDGDPNKMIHRIAFYDKYLNFISDLREHVVAEGRTFTTPVSAYFLRTSYRTNAKQDTIQIELGSQSTDFEPFRILVDDLDYQPKVNSVGSEELKPKSITKEKMAFTVPEAVPTKNIFNEDAIIPGFYANNLSGGLSANSLHWSSAIIPVEELEKYTFNLSSGLRVAYYDINSTFISGQSAPVLPISTPANTAFMQFSMSGINADGIQFEKGEVTTDYQPYGYSLPGLILSSGDKDVVILNLPKKMQALVGQEFNIYFDNIISGKDTDYDFDVVCSKGRQFERFFRFVPDVKESRPITINVYKDREIVASATSTITVSDGSAGTGVTRNLVIIGDSTVNSGIEDETGYRNGMLIRKLYENFADDPMDVVSLGTQGTSSYRHEGRSGWRAQDYVESAQFGSLTNAFWNPTTSAFDFSYYMTTNGFVVPDYVVINLGINDTFSYTTDDSLLAEAELIIGRYNTMINSIQAYNSNIKIGISVTIPPNYSQDGFAQPYSANQTRTRYKRNNILWVKRLIERYQGRESENIHLIPIHVNLDTAYNFGFVDMQINARNQMITKIPHPNGGVHPDEFGYWQVADIYWYWLKYFEN